MCNELVRMKQLRIAVSNVWESNNLFEIWKLFVYSVGNVPHPTVALMPMLFNIYLLRLNFFFGERLGVIGSFSIIFLFLGSIRAGLGGMRTRIE
jgi:hypothetical protein